MSERVDQARSHDYYVDMVEEKYFANVDRKNLDGVLECFAEDAVFTIQSHFTVHEGRDAGIKKMFEGLFATYEPKIVHKDFEHVVDVENNRCSAKFNVELVEADGGKELTFSNCNFFFLDENGKFERVFVWFSGENVLVSPPPIGGGGTATSWGKHEKASKDHSSASARRSGRKQSQGATPGRVGEP
jgi:ketosteroid isomerase-like protein